jgi:hypothetical protein
MSRHAHPTGTDDASSDESTEADHDAKTPVNPVRLSESGRQFIIDECVICGERHGHGARDATVANGGRSHRASHCHGADHSGGYYLELADDEEPPEWWYGWVNRDTSVEVSG